MNTLPPRRSDLLVFHQDEPLMYVFPSGDDPYAHEPTQEELLEANVELFARPRAIPLQNRLRYLIGDQELGDVDPYRYIELDELAAKLDAFPEDLIPIILDLNVPHEMVRADAFDNLSIASGIDVVVADEFTWRKIYAALDDEVPVSVIADIFGTSHGAMAQQLKTIGIRPRISRDPDALRHYYPKTILFRLRAERMIFPPARDDRTLYQMVGAIGCSSGWAQTHIDERFEPDLKRSANGKVLVHYVPEAENDLNHKYHPDHEEASTLRNVTQIAHDLGRAVTWVRPRIIKFRKYRIESARGVEYDESVFQALEKQSSAERKVPVISEGEVNLRTLIAPLDTTMETAGFVIKKYGLEMFKRRSDHSTRVYGAYHLSTRLPLAEAIIKYREEQVASYADTLDRLSAQPLETLTTTERKTLTRIPPLLAIARKNLERARVAYEKLLNEPTSTDA